MRETSARAIAETSCRAGRLHGMNTADKSRLALAVARLLRIMSLEASRRVENESKRNGPPGIPVALWQPSQVECSRASVCAGRWRPGGHRR
jgi:hypothetical protein